VLKLKWSKKIISVKQVIKGAELGATAMTKNLDMQLRAEETRLRNETSVEDTKIQQEDE
jgi:hypothetical protein